MRFRNTKSSLLLFKFNDAITILVFFFFSCKPPGNPSCWFWFRWIASEKNKYGEDQKAKDV